MDELIVIDGSAGEGGGQVLRTSLALSLATGKPFRIENIRANRRRPGLMRQHLLAVHAAREIGGARVTGAEIGSRQITFEPTTIAGGEYHFSVGSAGSTTLVTQTVLPALLIAGTASSLNLEGGTHNPLAPPFDFLQRVFLPVLHRMGARATANLIAHGFYPAGGGKATIRIDPSTRLTPIELIERGPILKKKATAIVSRLPMHIAEREIARMQSILGWPSDCFQIKRVEDSPGPGNVVLIELECANITEVFTAFGEKGIAAEIVADRVSEEAIIYIRSSAVAGVHLADQLLVPFAMAGGGVFTTLPLTTHTTTNIETIHRFLDVEIRAKPLEPGIFEVAIRS